MNWCGGKDEIPTPYGPLNNDDPAREDYYTALMLNQKFQDFVNDGEPKEYEEARHMFANPLEYFKSISTQGKGADDSEEEQEQEGKKKKKSKKALSRTDYEELVEPQPDPERDQDSAVHEGGSPGGLRKGRKKKESERQGRRAPQGEFNEGGQEDFNDMSSESNSQKDDPNASENCNETGASDGIRKRTEEESVEFYGPIYPEYSDASDDGRPVQDENKRYKFDPGYVLIEKTHARERSNKFVFEKGGENVDQFANKVRYYLFTYKESKKGRTVLHYAALNGDRNFCTMIIHEANEMGILREIIDQPDNDDLTPLYLLCEKGYMKEDDDTADEAEAEDGDVDQKRLRRYQEQDVDGDNQDGSSGARKLRRSHEDFGLEYARDDETFRNGKSGMRRLIDSECKKQSRAYLVKLLITNRANPNMQSPTVEHTPLHWLAYWGDWRAVNQLLKLNTIDKIKLEESSLWKTATLNGPGTIEEFLAERGAFNSFQTYDGQTPVDIAGDLGHFKCVKYIIKHFLKEKQQQTIMEAFITDEKKREHGLNAFARQQTKDILRLNGFEKVDPQQIKILYPSSKFLTKIQKSYINIVYWACYCMQSDQSKEFNQDQAEVKNFVYLFIMDCGVSPFVKAYEGRTLISATVPSESIEFLTELLSHTYMVRFEEDFEELKKRCKSKDAKGNNLLHEVCMLKEAKRNKYFEVINSNHVCIVYKPFEPIEYIPPEERSTISWWYIKDRIKATGLMRAWQATLGAGCGPKCLWSFIKVLLIILICFVPFLILVVLMLVPILLMALIRSCRACLSCCPKRQRKKIKSHHCIPGDYTTSEPKGRPAMYSDKPSRKVKSKMATFKSAKTMEQVQAVKDQQRERVKELAKEKTAELKQRRKQGLGTMIDGPLGDSYSSDDEDAENQREDDQARASRNSDDSEEEEEEVLQKQDMKNEEDKEEEGRKESDGRTDRQIIKDDKDLSLTKEVRLTVQVGDFKKRNRQALLPHQLVHKQPLAMKRDFLTAAKRHERAPRVLFDDLKELYVENFEADFVIVIKREKYAFITEQLEEDLDIREYNQDEDKTCPQLARSVYFEFEKGEENKLKGTSKDIYLAWKFSASMIDETAHAHKIYGDLIENSIRFKFHKLMHDSYVAFDARQHFECILKHVESQMDLAYLMQSGSIENFFPLHRTKAFEAVSASIDKYETKIFMSTFFGDPDKYLEPIHFLRRYYGEKYAFFYLFFYHYIAYLTFPAIISLLFMAIQVYYMMTYENRTITNTILDSEFNGYFGLITAIWTTSLVESWRKREQKLSFEWDLDILKDKYEGTERQEFKFMSMYDSNTNVRTKTSIRNQQAAKAYNIIFMLFMFAIVALTIMVIDTPETDDSPLTAESLAESISEDLYQPLGFLISAIIFIYQMIYSRVSNHLIEGMNFKYQHDFDDTTTIQSFVFNFVNTFFPFCFVAFNPRKRGQNFNTLFSMLVSTMLIDEFGKSALPRFLRYFVFYRSKMDDEKKSIEEKEIDIDVVNIKDKVESQVQFNYAMEEYDPDIVGEYMDVSMQYSMVALFSNVLPVASVLYLLVNLIKLQAMKMEFRYKRRAIPQLSFGIGQFLGIFEIVSYLAVLINICISYIASVRFHTIFTTSKEEGGRFAWTEVELLLGFIALEHVMCVIKAFIGLQTQANADVGKDEKEAARAIYRKNHEFEQDKRIDAYKHVATKFSNLFYVDDNEEARIRQRREAREAAERRAKKVNFVKKHTRMKPIHRTLATYKEGRQAEIQLFPDRPEDYATAGENDALKEEITRNIVDYASKIV